MDLRQKQALLLVGEVQEKEPEAAIIACNDYLRLGAGRSIRGLIEVYQDLSRFSSTYKPLTLSEKTLYTYSSRYSWAERAATYDADWERRKNEESSNARNAGLALESERIKKLNRAAMLLEAQIYQQDEDGNFINIWLVNKKSIKTSDGFQIVETKSFNGTLIAAYTAVLADLAAESGGRVRKVDSQFDGQIVVSWPSIEDDEEED
jgi:hypothetical protein